MTETVPVKDTRDFTRSFYTAASVDAAITAAVTAAIAALGGAASLNVGTTAGTVAAGNDTRIAPSQIASDRGYVAWSQPINLMSTATALATAGTVYLRRIRRVPPASITNMIIYVGTAGSVLTSGQCFGALYTAAGTLIGQTADQAAAWATTGLKPAALAGGPFTLTAGDYYAALWFNGVTGPSPVRSGFLATGLINAGLSAPNFEVATADTSITTTAPTTFGTQTTFNNEFWVALS